MTQWGKLNTIGEIQTALLGNSDINACYPVE